MEKRFSVGSETGERGERTMEVGRVEQMKVKAFALFSFRQKRFNYYSNGWAVRDQEAVG